MYRPGNSGIGSEFDSCRAQRGIDSLQDMTVFLSAVDKVSITMFSTMPTIGTNAEPERQQEHADTEGGLRDAAVADLGSRKDFYRIAKRPEGSRLQDAKADRLEMCGSERDFETGRKRRGLSRSHCAQRARAARPGSREAAIQLRVEIENRAGTTAEGDAEGREGKVAVEESGRLRPSCRWGHRSSVPYLVANWDFGIEYRAYRHRRALSQSAELAPRIAGCDAGGRIGRGDSKPL